MYKVKPKRKEENDQFRFQYSGCCFQEGRYDCEGEHDSTGIGLFLKLGGAFRGVHFIIK